MTTVGEITQKVSTLKVESPIHPSDNAMPTPGNQIISRFTPKHTQPMISCFNCGNQVISNGFSMCNDCIALSVDITEDLPRDGVLTFCKNCGRIHSPPTQWLYAERESRELMGILLKRLKGFTNDIRFMDARFIWTEPHSRRTKLKVTVQGAAKQYNNLIIQQTYTVEFYEQTTQCPDCAKSYTANTWTSSIQLRQKVEHKKTFLYLEQLILKNKAHKDTVSISESREGLDFFYNSKLDSIKMMDFLSSVVPLKYKKSEELVSQNTHTGNKSFKFTYSAEIAPVCREDLVVLPKKVARANANITQVVLCHKINQNIHLIDPSNLQTVSITSQAYWKQPFTSVSNSKNLTEFMVLDIEPLGPSTDKFALAEVTVARSADLGTNDTTFYVRSHLGGILHVGDIVMGYDLTTNNFNHAEWENLNADQTPEIVLVKKVYPDKPKSTKKHLKRMAKEYNLDSDAKGSKRVPGQTKDYDEFLEELENDEELQKELEMSESDGPDFDMEELNLDDAEDESL